MSGWRLSEDGRLESPIVLNENGKPIRIGRDGRVDSPEPRSIGHELCALLEKPEGSVEIVEYAEFRTHRTRGARDDGSKAELALRSLVGHAVYVA